jgi:hypothetical protein
MTNQQRALNLIISIAEGSLIPAERIPEVQAMLDDAETRGRKRPGTVKKFHPDECLWKQKFERLAQAMDDLKFDIVNGGWDVAENRAWDATDEIFVSFALDVCDDEGMAIEKWGEGRYDVYRLHRRAEDPESSNPPGDCL